MSWLSMMYVVVGGGVGALCRYLTVSAIGRAQTVSFPLGTFTVNVLGCFLLGIWIATMAATLPSKTKDLHLLFAVGALGGFTTFSAFSLDIFLLMERGLWSQLVLYVGGSVALSVLALVAGMWLAHRLVGG